VSRKRDAARGIRPPAARSAQRSLGQIVLGFEFVVVLLGALVIFGLRVVPAWVALTGGAVVALAMLVTIPLMRYRWGFALGWVLQVVVVAAGFLITMMFIVGGIFTAMWTYCMITGAKLDRAAAERTAVTHPPEPDAGQPDAGQPERSNTDETEKPE
jgi:hypothetical protein